MSTSFVVEKEPVTHRVTDRLWRNAYEAHWPHHLLWFGEAVFSTPEEAEREAHRAMKKYAVWVLLCRIVYLGPEPAP